MLRLAGYDAGNERGIYRLALPRRGGVIDESSRGRLLIGLRAGL